MNFFSFSRTSIINDDEIFPRLVSNICKSTVFQADFCSTLDYPNRHATYRNAVRAIYDVFPFPVLALKNEFLSAKCSYPGFLRVKFRLRYPDVERN